MHQYERLEDETDTRISHSGPFLAEAPTPKIWVDFSVEDWHQPAKPVIESLGGEYAFQQRFSKQERHDTKTIDTEGAVAIVGERHLFGEVIEVFNEWLVKVHNYSAKVLYMRTFTFPDKTGKMITIRPDVTVVAARHPMPTGKQTGHLFRADSKKAGSIHGAGFNSLCKDETEAKKLMDSETFKIDMKRANLGEKYPVIVQKGTGYALALNVPVVCIYDYHTLVIQYCPDLDPNAERPFKGDCGFRTLLRNKTCMRWQYWAPWFGPPQIRAFANRLPRTAKSKRSPGLSPFDYCFPRDFLF